MYSLNLIVIQLLIYENFMQLAQSFKREHKIRNSLLNSLMTSSYLNEMGIRPYIVLFQM